MLFKKIDLKFEKVHLVVQIITRTLYNLHIYNEYSTLLRLITHKGEYINIVNSYKTFSSELEDMKTRSTA